ncbi:MAG TPA: hypothetical protein VF163_18495 [Micromonosporaceae bacterium]
MRPDAAGQPRGRRGTVGHPNSAPNLRLALAAFGLVVCLVFAILSWHADLPALAVVLAVGALVAVPDLVVVSLRRRDRRRAEPGRRHSLFE